MYCHIDEHGGVSILEIALSHFYKCCPLLVLKVEAQLLLMACYKVCLHHVHLFIHGFIKPIPIMKNLHVAKYSCQRIGSKILCYLILLRSPCIYEELHHNKA